MKKIMFMALTAAAFSFSSCGNTTSKDAPDGDTVAVSLTAEDQAAEDAVEAAKPVIAELTQKLEANDAEGVAKILDQVKEQIAKLDPAQTTVYVKQVQDFINSNKDKIQSLVANNAAVNQFVSTITSVNAEEVANSIINAAKNQVEDAANEAVDAAKDEAKKAVENEVNKQKEAAKAKANEAISNAASKILGN